MDDMSSSSPSVITYHRRIDRTPEKDFSLRPEDNKKLVSEVRRSVEGVRTRFTRLQDDIDERDKTIEVERELRRAAEERLQAHLVNMYNSTDVNEELRERLPRANKVDPLNKTAETESSQVEEFIDPEQDLQQHSSLSVQERSSTDERLKSRTPDLCDLESQILQSVKISDDKSLSSSSHGTDQPKSDNMNNPAIPVRPGISGSYGLYNPYLSMPTAPMYQSPYLSQYGSPLLQSTFQTTPRLPVAQRLPFQLQNSPVPMQSSFSLIQQSPLLSTSNPTTTSLPRMTQGDETDRPLNVNDLSSAPREDNKDSLKTDSSASASISADPTKPVTSIGGQFNHPVSFSSGLNYMANPQRSSMFLSHNSPVLHSNVPDPGLPLHSPFRGSVGNVTMSNEGDNSRQIALLLAELDTAKAINKKLTDKLCDAEQELVTLKGRLKTEEVEKSVNTEAKKAADLVQEVHSAQKRRDESMMGRLQVANNEKDEMVNRLREIEQRLEDQGFSEVRSDDDFEEEMDSSVENLLLKINQAETLGDMEQEYSTLAQRLELMKQRQREITAEEMQDILEQRDLARAKARKLEEELLRHQRNEVLNNTGQKLQLKLASVIQERDLAQAQVKQLRDEILKMQMIYSLHKSLAQEPYLRDQMNNTLAVYQSKLKQQVGQVDTACKENNNLISQVQDLEADLQKKEAQIEKYEKLVNILRRKLKSQHIVNVEDEN